VRARHFLVPVLTAALLGTLLPQTGAPPAAAISSLGSIPVGEAPVSIELRPDGAVAFVANYFDGNAGTVSALNLATQTTTSITVGAGPQDVRMRPASNEVWVSNRFSGTISVIDATTFASQGFFSTSGGPHDIEFSANGTRAYVTIDQSDQVRVFDTATQDLLTSYSVGDVPTGIALDAERNRLVVASGGSTATGDRVNFVNLGTGAVTSLAMPGDANGVYVDAARDRAYVSLFGLGFVAVINLTNDSVVKYISIGGSPNGMRPSFDNRLLFVARGSQIATINLELELQRGFYTTPSFTNDVAMSLDGRTVYSTAYNEDAVAVAQLEIDRFAGADRYATAITMSQEAYPGTSNIVYIASATSFADALSIAPAVSYKPGPLLLTARSSVRADVMAEIARLQPLTIVIAGGTGVVSAAAQAQLEATGAEIIRYSGADRYDTSRTIVSEIFREPGGYEDLYLVTGRNFPDALSAGPAAGANDMPMLLVNGSASTLPAETLALIDTLQIERVILVGGTGVMSTSIQNQVDALPGVSVVRTAGADRYATSQAVNEFGFDNRTSPASYWATGANFPDALAGITLAAPINAPVYLVKPTCLPSAALHGAWRHNADRVGILGGTSVVSTAVENLVRC